MKSKKEMWMEFLNIVLATTAISMTIMVIGIYTGVK
jgi:hypothetical protein